MSEFDVEQEPSVESAAPEPEAVRTGIDEVDAVLASLDGLDERPLAEHVEVFGTAHEQLRGALDATHARA